MEVTCNLAWGLCVGRGVVVVGGDYQNRWTFTEKGKGGFQRLVSQA